MTELKDLIKKNEEWLMERILEYAKRRNYTKYTSTLIEAWRISIEGLSEAVCMAIDSGMDVDLDPDESFSGDPVAAFGVLEARKHRARGISYPMFIGLFKYYVQSYMDLINKETFPDDLKEKYKYYLLRVFDRIEIAFSSEWISLRASDELEDLKEMNRKMTNEKNMFLTVVESLANPVFFLNDSGAVEYINKSASELLDISGMPGGFYYSKELPQIEIPPWLKEHVDVFFSRNRKEIYFEAFTGEVENRKSFQGRVSRMEDISDKYSGAVVILNDITRLIDAWDRIKNLLTEKELILKEVHHRIKNNMNMIKGLLILQADSLTDSAAISVLHDAESRVTSMMLLYDKLYRSDNFNKVSFRDYLSFLVDDIVSNSMNKKNIKVVKKIDDFILDVKLMQPIGMIVNELLTNMIKHAFQGIDGGIISVSAKVAGKNVILIIGDNGVGIPESVDFLNSTGFGMQLVKMLTEQIDGSIRIERGNGTRFVLEFSMF